MERRTAAAAALTRTASKRCRTPPTRPSTTGVTARGRRCRTSGYRIERVDDGRALLSWDVEERTRVAVVVKEDVTDYQGHTGWGVESWASCDPAELGDEVAADLGIELWTDANGRPVPTSEVVSSPGPEHCGWQDTTWLHLGLASDIDRTYDEYVSNDDGGELADYLTTTADDSAPCPTVPPTPAGSATAVSSGSASTRVRRTWSASTTSPMSSAGRQPGSRSAVPEPSRRQFPAVRWKLAPGRRVSGETGAGSAQSPSSARRRTTYSSSSWRIASSSGGCSYSSSFFL